MFKKIGPGIVTTIWLTIFYTSKYERLKENELISIVKTVGFFGGALPYEDGFSASLDYGFICKNNNDIELSRISKTIGNLNNQIEPNTAVIREIILKIIHKEKPIWLAYLNLPFEDFIIYLPDDWKELFSYANLLDNNDTEAQKWWTKINIILKEKNDEMNMIIGERGEEFTIAFEKKRLRYLGLINEPDDHSIVWVSKISNRFGYDVKSICGDFGLEILPLEDICIEVKSQAIYSERFAFFLTRNEYEQAKRKDHIFYFWNGVFSDSYKLFVAKYSDIANLVPKDSPDGGNWTECQIVINFKIQPYFCTGINL